MTIRVTLASGWKDALARESHPEREAAIDRAADTARRLCPLDTGRLVGSIAGEADQTSMAMRLSAGNDIDITYAAYVELGTRHMHAQPYLRPALNSI